MQKIYSIFHSYFKNEYHIKVCLASAKCHWPPRLGCARRLRHNYAHARVRDIDSTKFRMTVPSNAQLISMADNFFNEQLHVTEFSLTRLVLYVVRAKLMKFKKLFQLLAGVETVFQRQNIIELTMGLKVRDLFITEHVWIGKSSFWEKA